MTIRYHITENGPAVCEAKVRDCPYGAKGGYHFEDYSEAEKSYEKSQGGATPKSLKKQSDSVLSTSSKIYAPDPADFPKLELDEVKDIFSKLKKFPKEISHDIQAFGYLGSGMYGLNHEDSDRDVWILVDGKGKGYYSMSEDMDVRVDTFGSFYEKLWDNVPDYVDLMRSRDIQFSDNKYASILRAFRFNERKYADSLMGYARADFELAARNNENKSRIQKNLKIGTRSIIMAQKVITHGQFFNPSFNAVEREHFYKTLSEVQENYANGMNAQNLVKLVQREAKIIHP